MKIQQLSELLPDALLRYALQVEKKYRSNPEYVAHYLEDFLAKSEYKTSRDPAIRKIKTLIKTLKKEGEKAGKQQTLATPDGKESLKQAISEFYLPRQLVNGIMELGEIPSDPEETWIGVGFIDIADYSYISRWLSPKENQVVLNGLYSALKIVLDQRGGYLNKMEGDSMMFQFGGMIDPRIKGKSLAALKQHISRELFYTCIEMQNVCSLFNQANSEFLKLASDKETKKALFDGFNIISNLRDNLSFASAINTLFQIRIRIGANIGEVCIGNFGPLGAKQWDIIGVPVIEAKRMESTAPIGGLRISEALYNQLKEDKINTGYLNDFRNKAAENDGYYGRIQENEVFKFAEVTLQDKKGRRFKTYSVQVDPQLPENLQQQVEALVEMGLEGTEKIIEILQYYRGNKHVLLAIEDKFRESGIFIRKELLLQTICKKNYTKILDNFKGDHERCRIFIEQRYSLYSLFQLLGKYQDYLNEKQDKENEEGEAGLAFENFEQYFNGECENIRRAFINSINTSVSRHRFYNKMFPQVFLIIKAAILEYQHRREEQDSLEGTEVSA